VTFIGVVGVRLLSPDGGDQWVEALATRITIGGASNATAWVGEAGRQVEVVPAHNAARVFELQDALPHQSAGYRPGDGIRLLEVVAFIHQEEEGLVLLNGTAQAAAKAVVNPDSARLSEPRG